jgi:hypothetical protein
MKTQLPQFPIGSLLLLATVLSCAKEAEIPPGEGGGGAATPSTGTAGGGGSEVTGGGGASFTTSTGGGGGEPCNFICSPDLHAVLDCQGNVLETCTGDQGCDITLGACVNACDATVQNQSSIGCEYWATYTDTLQPSPGVEACFAAVVANNWDTPAQIAVEYDGQLLDIAAFARIPTGPGPTPVLAPFDAAAGLAPGEVAVLFLAGSDTAGHIPCPIPSAVPAPVHLEGASGVGKSFKITSDVPVVAYQFNPYGGAGGTAHGVFKRPGASLLIPTSGWTTNYMAVTPGPAVTGSSVTPKPSINIIAREDGTTVTILPQVDVEGGGALPGGVAGVPLTVVLDAGEHAQFTQTAELVGSIVESDKPVGLMAAHQCQNAPAGPATWLDNCDHAEQMIPPITALGHEYVAVPHKPRVNESAIFRLIGATEGTVLTWTGTTGPSTLSAGEVVQVLTDEPFTVKSQDQEHPFFLFQEMLGSDSLAVCYSETWPVCGYGDPDFVLIPPPEQYLQNYTFFADPTYPVTNLVVVRSKKQDGSFADVTLDCLGVVSGWQPIGEHEWAHVDLTTGEFEPVGACAAGTHTMESEAPFGLWVWGWGGTGYGAATKFVSYGYPAGMSLHPVNDVLIPAVPR